MGENHPSRIPNYLSYFHSLIKSGISMSTPVRFPMKYTHLLIICFFIWRLFLFIPLFVGHTSLHFNSINAPVQLWAYTRPYKPVDSFFLYPWANFDGVHYLTVAYDGYRRGAEGRFFPFYPFLIYVLSNIFGEKNIYGIGEFFAAFFIANVSFFLSILVLFKLLLLDYSEKIAFWSILFLLVFPTSFFFGSIYTESLYLLLSLVSLYFARRKQFLFASIAGSLLTLTRSVGVLIILPLAYEFFHYAKKHPKQKHLIYQSLPLVFIPAAMLGFMLFNYHQWHDWLYFVHAQEAVTQGRSHLVLFIPQTIYRYGKILLSLSAHQFEWWVALLEISTFFVTTILLYFVVKKKIYLPYAIFAIACFLIPSVTGTFSGLPRYVSTLFPIFIIPASIQNRYIKISLAVFCTLILFLLTMFFSRGYLVS